AHGQADDGQHQHQQHDQPVQQLAHRAPAVGRVFPAHGVGSGAGVVGGSSTGGSSAGASSGGASPAPASSTGAVASEASSAVAASSASTSSACPPRARCASASMRSPTASPITPGHASMPNALRLIVVVAENPTVRRNGGSG